MAVTQNYVTYFDHNRAAQGLALHGSMLEHCQPFHLWTLPLTRECRELLQSLHLNCTTWINEDQLEPQGRLRVCKATREWRWWCFTLASVLCDNLLRWAAVPSVMYLDADMWFMDDPSPVFGEIAESQSSIAATPHRFPPRYAHYIDRGKFNQAATWFKNDQTGRHCTMRWASLCIDRCDAESVGDQKYLNMWPSIYGESFHPISDPRWNVGPWNMLDSYDFSVTPILVHMHEFQKGAAGCNQHRGYRLTNYEICDDAVEKLYDPYLNELEGIEQSCVHLIPRGK